ncbi:MAG: MFS transporter [Chlamydiota bacterium]
MTHLLKIIISPIISLTLFVVSSAYFNTFTSVRFKLAGFDETTIGYLHSAFYLGYLIGSAKVERLIRRVGHIRAFSAFSSINIIWLMVLGLLPLSKEVWILARLFTGICMASLFIVIESWLIAKSTIKTRGQILAIYMAVLYASQSGSQLILNYIDPLTSASYLLAALLSAAAIFPLAITKTVSPKVEEPTLSNVFKLFHFSPLGWLGCFMGGMILSSIYSFTPNFAQEYGLKVSYIMTITIGGGFLLQWPIGKLSDILDRRKVLIGVASGTLLPSFCLLLFPKFSGLVMVASFLLGGLIFTIYPLSISQVCDRIEDKNIHSAIGQLSLIYGGGAIVGPLFAPIFTNAFGLSALYLYVALVAGSLLVTGLQALSRRPEVSIEEQSEYVAIPPRSSPVAANLDPRGEQADSNPLL